MTYHAEVMFLGAVVIMLVGLLQHDPRVNFGVSLAVCLHLGVHFMSQSSA